MGHSGRERTASTSSVMMTKEQSLVPGIVQSPRELLREQSLYGVYRAVYCTGRIVQCSVVLYMIIGDHSTVQYCKALYSTVPYDIVLYSTIQYCTVLVHNTHGRVQ